MLRSQARRRLLGVIATWCLVLVACAPQPSAGLAGSSWQLVQYWDETAGSLRGVAERAPTLTFHGDDRLQGTGGCNSITGAYRVTDGKLEFQRVASTEMYCYPPGAPATGESVLMVQEAAFLKALGSVTRYTADGGGLQLLAGDRLVLVLAPR